MRGNQRRRHRLPRTAFRTLAGELLERRDLLAQFVDATADVGLDAYLASTGDAHGPGAVFTDLDSDGYPDLYVVRSGEANQLYLNRPLNAQRVFERAPGDAGAGHTGAATGAIAGDYDNDGDLDLFVLNFDEDNALLENQLVETGQLSFVDVTAQTDPTPAVADDQFGLRTATWDGISLEKSLTAAWADPDRDGDLDLYVGNHHEWLNSPLLGVGERAGQRDIFYRNNGDGTFTDVTMQYGVTGFETATGLTETSNQYFSSTNAVIFADFNNDLWPDLLVTNKVGGGDDREMLYVNRGANADGSWQGFELMTYDLPTTFGHLSGGAMGVAVADIEHDGDLDIYITDWSSAGGFANRAGGRNDLWLNQFSDTGQLDFVHSGDAPALFSWGVQWEDFDNNGFQDLHVATHRGAADFYYANRDGVLIEESATSGFGELKNARGDVAADFDRDGWLDLFVVNIDDATSIFYENRPQHEDLEHHFLSLQLVGNPDLPGGLRSTRDAVGARVVVNADLDGDGELEPRERLIREVQTGSSNAASTSSLQLEFGLGLADRAEVVVHWPSGRVTDLGVIAADDFLTVHELQTTVGPTVAIRADNNLVINPGFEEGVAPWLPQGASVVAASTATSRQGLFSGHVTGRTATWNGVGQSLIGVMEPGVTYQISVFVKLDGVDAENIGLTLQQIDGNGTRWTPIEWSVGSQSEWVELSGSYTLDVAGTLQTLFLYVEGPSPGVGFFVDDLTVEVFDPNAWKAEANARIEELRKRDARIEVVDANGVPVPGAVVSVSQQRHAFGLGTTINSFALPNPQYAAFLRDNFEWGVMEFEAKWHETEQSPGNVNYSRADSIVEFAEANDITLRGHTLFWGVEQFVPSWVRALTGQPLRDAMDSRLASVMNHFRGTFEHWDVNNEMLHGGFYESRLPGIRPTMFQQARNLDPDVKLFVNDYEIISGGLAETYKTSIEELLAAGAPIDGIGVQGHFPAAPAIVSPVDVLQRLDVLGPLGLPVWVTEFDVQHPDPNARADQLESVYRAVFSHPAVDGILMWGFWAGAHWRGADAALVDMDFTVNTAGRRYQELVDEWTTSTSGSTNEVGTFDWRGFHGTYDVTVSIPGVGDATRQVVLAEGAGRQVIQLDLELDLPTVSLSIDQATIPEAGGVAMVTASLSQASPLPVTVQFSVLGTADTADYSVSATEVVIPAGELAASISIMASQDAIDEPTETIVIEIASVLGAGEAGNQQVTTSILDDDLPPSFRVTSVTPNDSGLRVEFSHSLDPSSLNLYPSAAAGPADMEVAGDASGLVAGTLLVEEDGRSVTFVKSGGPLVPDNYTLTLRSGHDGFKSAAGDLLDGDLDGTGGDGMTTTFAVARAANTVSVRVPDMVRGPGQPVQLPADGLVGIPLVVEGGTGVRAVTVRLRFNPALLTITAASVDASLPAGATVSVDLGTEGQATISFASPTPLGPDATTIANLAAAVPAGGASGNYGRRSVISVDEMLVLDGAGLPLPAIGDDSVHVASFFGDVSGNGRINAADAAQVARVAALLESAFPAALNVDPLLLGDITGNGRLNAADASRLARFAALLPVPEIPPIPQGVLIAGRGWELEQEVRQGEPLEFAASYNVFGPSDSETDDRTFAWMETPPVVNEESRRARTPVLQQEESDRIWACLEDFLGLAEAVDELSLDIA